MWKIFVLDTVKQVVGQVIVHFINLYISIFFTARVGRNRQQADECSWYFTTFLVDLFPGLALILLLSFAYERIFLRYDLRTLMPGNYVEDHDGLLFIRKGAYVMQVLLWVSVLLITKLCLFVIQMPLLNTIGAFSAVCLRVFDFSVDFKLFFVMIIFPLVVNVLAFWISDNLLKKKVWFPNEQSLRKSFFEPDQSEIITTLMHLNINKTHMIRTSVGTKNF